MTSRNGAVATFLIGLSLAVGLSAGCADLPADGSVDENALTAPVDVTGFESTAGWHLLQGTLGASLATSSTHTKGKSSLAFTKPASRIVFESINMPSTNPELVKIARGTSISMDFLVPAQAASLVWSGSAELEIQAPSRGIRLGSLGIADVTSVRKGIFTTLHFPIPDAIADALAGKTYSDFSFWLKIKVPEQTTGTYLLDNIRVRGKLAPSPTSVNQITAGQSILLQPWKSYAPAASFVAAQTFTAGVIQVPQKLHVSKGRVGTGTATFEYRLGTGAIVTCKFVADSAAAGLGYKLSTCGNGALAGDLVPADWVRLTVVGGDSTAGKTKLKAQIALNPLGDELSSGLPPIPTYFGTTGAEIAAALDAFVQAERNWKLPDAEIVHLPTPDVVDVMTATRNGIVLPPSKPADNDPPFALDGRLTGTDMVDVGWHVNGAVEAPITPDGARDTHFGVDIGADVWLLTFKANSVVGITGHVDTHTPAPVGTTIPPTTTSGDFCYGYLGISQTCVGGFSGMVGVKKNIANAHPSINLVSIDYWIFHGGADGVLDLVVDLTGGFTPNGFALVLTPTAGLSVRVEAGLKVGGFVGGGVFAQFHLVDVSAPITASVNAVLNASPLACNVHLSEGLSGTVTLSSGGGRIGYYIEGGLTCGYWGGLCWRDEGDLKSWVGTSKSWDILPAQPLANQDIPLPDGFCTPKGDAEGGISYPLVGEVFSPGDFSFMQAEFFRTYADSTVQHTSSGDIVLSGKVDIACDGQVWKSTDPSDTIEAWAPCYNKIRYGNPGKRTISVFVTDPILGTGTAQREVTVGAGDPATAPIPTMHYPVPYAVGPECGDLLAWGQATDPNSLDTTLAWYQGVVAGISGAAQSVTLTQSGTGENASIGHPAEIARLVATNSAGQSAMFEVPVEIHCVK
jgi:hypothetical protein